MNNPFRLIASRVIYQNEYVTLHEDMVLRPNGSTGPFSWLEMKAGAIVLALSDQQDVYLVREYKYAIGRPSLEAVGGGIDPGETPLAAAQRELQEEAGLSATEWTEMGVFQSFTTLVNSPNYLYLARGISEVGGHHPEDGEILEVVKMPLSDAVEMVMRNEISHGPTCCLLLKAARLLGTA
ncbi:MAG: NUDIX hydrolase [Bryobacteraceae bacterium]|jgi:ADP-ribose pyrophosphatase